MRKSLKALVAGAVLAVSLLFAPSTTTEAAELVQVNPTKNSITLQWVPQEDALNYKVYVGTNYDNETLYATLPATTTTLTLPNLPEGSKYYISVKYDELCYDGSTYEYGIDSEWFSTLPGKVTNLAQERWYYYALSFNAQWDEMPAADGYEYIIKTSKGKLVDSGDISWNQVSCTGISNQKIYTVQVRAYNTINGQKYYGEWSDKGYFFTQPRIKTLKKSGKKITVKWGKVDGATGYDIYISTKPKTGYKKVKSVKANKTSYTIKKIGKKKLSSKKKYYVYVATVKKVGNRRYDSGKLYYWNTKQGPSSSGYF